jgi:hypothetical protein
MVKWRSPLLIATLLGLVAMAAALSNDGTVQKFELMNPFFKQE